MPDDRTDDRDRLTKLEARQEEQARLLGRQEDACQRRADLHVHKDMWTLRNVELNDRLASQGERLGAIESSLAELRREVRDDYENLRKDMASESKRQADWRERWRLGLVTAIVGPILAAVLTVLFVMLGVGS